MKIPMFPCKYHQNGWIFHGELLVLGRLLPQKKINIAFAKNDGRFPA